MRAPDTVDARQALAPLTAPLFSLGRSDHHRQIPRGWWLLLALSLAIAAYALAHVLLGERMSPPYLADSFRARPWEIYTHAAAAPFALAVGPLQFHGGPRARRLRLHRFLGRV